VRHGSKKLSMNKRRGVSNIIGSLIVLAVVASVGSVILFQGLNQINAFNYDLTFHDKQHSDAIREDILFEHVRFEPNDDELTLYLANVGTTETTIATITVVNIDTQELVVNRAGETNFLTNSTIQIEDHEQITVPAILPNGPGIWNSTEYRDSDYRISLTTSKGNFFYDIVTPPDMIQ
jgi:flagellin-like protein